MVEEIVIGAGRFLFSLIFEVFFCLTGEIILFFITFGKHQPRWDLYTNEKPYKFVVFSEISVWIGMAFWIIAVAVIYKLVY